MVRVGVVQQAFSVAVITATASMASAAAPSCGNVIEGIMLGSGSHGGDGKSFPGVRINSFLGNGRVWTPTASALRPLEMWCDFPPFSGFDFTLDSVLAPTADAAADDSLDDASSEEEPAKPPPPSKSKTKTPKRG